MNSVLCSGILPPRLLLQTGIILGIGLLDKVFRVEIKKLGVGELSKFIVNVYVEAVILFLLGGHVGIMSRGESIKVSEIKRDIGRFATFVAIGACHDWFRGRMQWVRDWTCTPRVQGKVWSDCLQITDEAEKTYVVIEGKNHLHHEGCAKRWGD